MEAGFISDTFSRKRMGLAKVGEISESLGGKKQGQQEQGWQEHQVLSSEDLCSWWDGGEEITY